MKSKWKKMIVVFLFAGTMFLMNGCKNDSNSKGLSEKAVIYIDPETKVNYIFYSEGYGDTSRAGLSVRYNSDGTIYVSE
ncbi:DUF6440 family protein [Enterococcus sp. LJL128]